MGITIIGDIHGYTKLYGKYVAGLPPGKRSIQIGDMGIGFPDVRLKTLAPEHKWFRGNHDNPAMCRLHPNYLGDYGFLKDDSIFYVAGAFSIDRLWRVQDVSWWADEELSHVELGAVIDAYRNAKPRFVVSHECPAKACSTLLYAMAGDYFAAKGGCSLSRTSQAMQAMLDYHQPEKWIFGHYHVDKSFTVPGYSTEFICVGGVMSGYEAPHTYELETGGTQL